jgi:hypothetical protein
LEFLHMTVRRGLVNELCFAAEGMAGTAAASSLRRLSSLAAQAPSGRLFGAISTLTEMSARATQSLERGHAALETGDSRQAALRLASALLQMDELTTAATPAAHAAEAPSYLRKTTP